MNIRIRESQVSNDEGSLETGVSEEKKENMIGEKGSFPAKPHPGSTYTSANETSGSIEDTKLEVLKTSVCEGRGTLTSGRTCNGEIPKE